MGFACFVVKHKINHGGHQGSKKIREGPGKTFFELFGQCFACFVIKKKFNHGGHQGSTRIPKGPGKSFFELFGQCFEHFVVKKDLTTEDSKVFERFVVKKKSNQVGHYGCANKFI